MMKTHRLEHICSGCASNLEETLRQSLEILVANVPKFIEEDGCAVSFRCTRCGKETRDVSLFSEAHLYRSLRPLLWQYGRQVAGLWSCAEASMANGCYAPAGTWGLGEFEQFLALLLAARDLTHMPEDSYEATMVLDSLKKVAPRQAGVLLSLFLIQVAVADFSPYQDIAFLFEVPEALEGFLSTLKNDSDRAAMRDALKLYDTPTTEDEMNAHIRLTEMLR